jgi:hypothetical protein
MSGKKQLMLVAGTSALQGPVALQRPQQQGRAATAQRMQAMR